MLKATPRRLVTAFLLEDKNHNAAHAFAFAEYLLEETFLSEKWLAYKRSPYLIVIGTLCCTSQPLLLKVLCRVHCGSFCPIPPIASYDHSCSQFLASHRIRQSSRAFASQDRHLWLVEASKLRGLLLLGPRHPNLHRQPSCLWCIQLCSVPILQSSHQG